MEAKEQDQPQIITAKIEVSRTETMSANDDCLEVAAALPVIWTSPEVVVGGLLDVVLGVGAGVSDVVLEAGAGVLEVEVEIGTGLELVTAGT